MRYGLDTSVVLRLLVGTPEAEATAARVFVAQVAEQRGECVISDVVIAESVFALKAHYGVEHERAARAMLDLGRARPMHISTAAVTALDALVNRSAGAGFVDRLIHSGYQSELAPLVTFDRKAGRLPDAHLLRG